jgi:hypothetical protein
MESLNVEPLSEMALIRFENSSHKGLYKAVGLDKLLKGLWRFHIYSSGSAAKVRLKLYKKGEFITRGSGTGSYYSAFMNKGVVVVSLIGKPTKLKKGTLQRFASAFFYGRGILRSYAVGDEDHLEMDATELSNALAKKAKGQPLVTEFVIINCSDLDISICKGEHSYVGSAETGVKITHRATGIAVLSLKKKSQYANKVIAMELLEIELAKQE